MVPEATVHTTTQSVECYLLLQLAERDSELWDLEVQRGRRWR